MLEKLRALEEKFKELSNLIIQPDIMSDQNKYIKISKEYKDLKEIIDKKIEYENILKNIEEAGDIIKNEHDKEMLELANSSNACKNTSMLPFELRKKARKGSLPN